MGSLSDLTVNNENEFKKKDKLNYKWVLNSIIVFISIFLIILIIKKSTN